MLHHLKRMLRRAKLRPPSPIPEITTSPAVESLGPVPPSSAGDEGFPSEWRPQWTDRGYVVARNLFAKEAVEAHASVVQDARRSIEESKDAHGYGDRLGQLHQRNPELMNLGADRRVRQFLQWAFGDTPLLFGSLNFERGSQQDAHIDAIFFYTEPVYAMAGLWVALEDVHPDAGPLFYLPGSHRWPFIRGEHLWDSSDVRSKVEKARRLPVGDPFRVALAGTLGQEWTRRVAKMENERGIAREEAVLRAGDAVIWHALLAHGGSARRDPKRSRRSVVYHFIGEHAKLYTFDQFFLETRQEMRVQQGQNVRRALWKDLPYMNYGYYASYKDGKELIHRL
jgi:ectoine hydroxylase-related dioxygenase (phytanoyl-CoA dioxygenase family)